MIICTNAELWKRWLDREIDPERIRAAAEAAAECFHFHGLATRLDPSPDFGKGLLRPYNYFATNDYFGHEPAFREAADVLLNHLDPRPFQRG